ncbi:MAG: glycosyltransferase family 8 protein [Candidatus Borkfalkiaceae bacterium]|nr:glycosyltransferase family 8 protein [Clostridia bacterium]MDY6223081.1 glycosyltransferase family 8 protein [Christensenellaceae bacterium]
MTNEKKKCCIRKSGKEKCSGVSCKAKKIVPVFFAADDKYVPYLAVTLQSIKEHASNENEYRIYVLHAGVSGAGSEKIKSFESENFKVNFVDVTERLAVLSEELQLRDYYSCATYYRIFIAGMFPEYDKAVYLDSDIVVCCDIAEFFDIEIGENYVAGVRDGAVGAVPVFQEYTKAVLGIEADKYFNAGVLLLNLKALRDEDFYGKFSALLKQYKFAVAQDQDYLNVLCRGRVKFLPDEWDAMPVGGATQELKHPRIIHYNLTQKPWHYETVMYSTYFWDVAKRTDFYAFLQNELKNFGEEEKANDSRMEASLLALAAQERDREDNYYNKYLKKA